MSEAQPVEQTNLDRYGNAVLPWSRPRDLLVSPPAGHRNTFILVTCGPDLRPHAAGVGVIWIDGDLF